VHPEIFPRAAASLPVIVHVQSKVCHAGLHRAVPGIGTSLVDGGWPFAPTSKLVLRGIFLIKIHCSQRGEGEYCN